MRESQVYYLMAVELSGYIHKWQQKKTAKKEKFEFRKRLYAKRTCTLICLISKIKIGMHHDRSICT